MKPSQATHALNIALTARRPAFIWGAPGIGKSAVVAQLAAARKVEMRDIRLSMLDPVDLKGFPTVNKAKTQMTWLPADFLPTEGEGILFLDEMNGAAQAVQAPAYQLVLDRRLGDYVLPDGWDIVAAGNRTTDRSVAHAMPAALANRFVHIDMEADLDDWCKWALDNDIAPELVAFMRFRPALLHDFKPSGDIRTFPSPRSWEFVNDIRKTNPPRDLEHELVKGCVGEGAAVEFSGFIRVIADLPSTDEILLSPDTAQMPTTPAALYALTVSLSRKTTAANFDQLMTYVERMGVDFQVVYVKDALASCKAITNTKRYLKWGLANQNVLM